jgi:hypothetical protein
MFKTIKSIIQFFIEDYRISKNQCEKCGRPQEWYGTNRWYDCVCGNSQRKTGKQTPFQLHPTKSLNEVG